MYYGVALALLLVALYAVWASFFNAAPTCSDGKQNGTELGIDCGGSCSLVCLDTAHDPTVLWSRAFQTGENSYTAAAYIRSNNIGPGAKKVGYAFYLFDESNSLIKEVDGIVDLPPVAVIPIIAPNITAGNRTVSNVKFSFSEKPIWHKVPEKSLPTIYISQQHIDPGGSRVSATLSNQTLTDAKNLTAVAVLFDSSGVARAASKSFVARIPARSTQSVEFTWPTNNPNIVRVEITVLPSF